MQDLHQRHAIEVFFQPGQQVLESLWSDAQFIAVGQVGGVVAGQHPVQHQNHASAMQLLAPHRGIEVKPAAGALE
ncbi:hypothetical protein D9M73_295680 [compost metagenome]